MFHNRQFLRLVILRYRRVRLSLSMGAAGGDAETWAVRNPCQLGMGLAAVADASHPSADLSAWVPAQVLVAMEKRIMAVPPVDRAKL